MPPVSLTMQACQSTGVAVGASVGASVGVVVGSVVGVGDAPPPQAVTTIAADATSAATLLEMRKVTSSNCAARTSQGPESGHRASPVRTFHDEATVSGMSVPAVTPF